MESFKQIELKSDYMSLRQALKDTFILFAMYNQIEDEETTEFLDSLKHKFVKDGKVQIVVVPIKSAEEKLVSSLRPEQDLTEGPFYGLAHPHFAEIELLQNNTSFNVYKSIERYNEYYKNNFENEKAEVLSKIKELVESFPVVLFIKGTPQDPFCKYSKAFMNIIKKYKFEYRAYDIFKSERIRGFMKFYHGWKTFPQIFINGILLGGLDVIDELDQKSEFAGKIPVSCRYDTKVDEIKKEVEASNIVFHQGIYFQNGKTELSQETKELIADLESKGTTNIKLIDINNCLIYEEVVRDLYGQNKFPVFVAKAN